MIVLHSAAVAIKSLPIVILNGMRRALTLYAPLHVGNCHGLPIQTSHSMLNTTMMVTMTWMLAKTCMATQKMLVGTVMQLTAEMAATWRKCTLISGTIWCSSLGMVMVVIHRIHTDSFALVLWWSSVLSTATKLPGKALLMPPLTAEQMYMSLTRTALSSGQKSTQRTKSSFVV